MTFPSSEQTASGFADEPTGTEEERKRHVKWGCPTCRAPLDTVIISPDRRPVYADLISRRQQLKPLREWSVLCTSSSVLERTRGLLGCAGSRAITARAALAVMMGLMILV